MKVIISGGGTGGHIFPAIAIADALKVIRPDTKIHFSGAIGKMEMDLVPKAGYDITGLPISGFQRKITLQNLSFPFRVLKSLWKAWRLLKSFKPDVAIGVGGYASGPTLQVASWLGIPIMVQEQNSYAGVTNRVLGRKAKKIFVAYDHMDKFFPADKILFTGNPVRSKIGSSLPDKKESLLKLGLNPENKTVFIFGGSLGAKTLNEAVLYGLTTGGKQENLNIIWQIGKYYWEKYSQSEAAKHKNVRVFPFIEDMAQMYAAADLVVCRAGALTISELAILGKPSLLVPSPNVAEDHQTANAMALVNRNAAVLVKDKVAVENVMKEVVSLVKDESRLQELTKNIKYFAKTDAAIKIAEEILTYDSSKSQKS
ncbi:MAG: undecaprenyldiphospho-muramoylpentapeptide beta-N-acetylglucosaminyltransferase [Saprospiraceae bacterium]|nr:undecaprenyldiphospho-muramoylpentapeptide beta-N-acetylglucosaminyltransferase [Saprospiraceae bacterium]